MKNFLIGVGCFLGVVLFVGIIFGTSLIGFKNDCVTFNKTIEAQVSDMKAKYNEYFLKVQEVSKVPTEQMAQLQKFYEIMIKGRETDGAMFKMITESNPSINQDTYVQIQRIIAAGRADIYQIQKTHIDTVREYNTFIAMFPNSIFAGFFGFKSVIPTVPVSDSVKTIFETGTDKEIELFK